jgi:SnoaL-like domain
MSDAWERSERATCTHPGWPTLRGWGPIAASWFALFQNGQTLQFVLTRERVEVVGDVGWATLDENLLGAEGGTTVAAQNLYVRDPDDQKWRMVSHHGSVVNSSISVESGRGTESGDDPM